MPLALATKHGHRDPPVAVEFHGFHLALAHIHRIPLGQAHIHFHAIGALPFRLFQHPGGRVFRLA